MSERGATGLGSRVRLGQSGLWKVVPAVGVLGVRKPAEAVGPVAQPINIYAQGNCTGGADTTVLTYVVPVLQTLNVLGVIGWGAYDAEFLIKINAVTIGGGRTSAARPTLEIYYDAAYKVASSGQTVTVVIRVNDFTAGTYVMKCNLLGSLI